MPTVTARDPHLTDLVGQPWLTWAGPQPLLVRPGTLRDLAAVARLHSRCSARSLLGRYRCGGSSPAVAALDHTLRTRPSVVAVRPTGEVVAFGTLAADPRHGRHCVDIGVLVEDGWQGRGIGRDLVGHLAGIAHVAGHRELITYPATAVRATERLLVEVGPTRVVPGHVTHLHTYLSDSATLGLGSVRQRLATA